MNDTPPPLIPHAAQQPQYPQSPYPQPANYAAYPMTPPPRRSACCGLSGIGCGLGCLVVVGLALALMIFAGVSAKSWLDKQMIELTSTEEVALTAPVASPAEITEAVEKFDEFRTGLEPGGSPVPIVLTAEELNLLIWNHPAMAHFPGKAKVDIVGDVLETEFSLGIDELPLPEGYFKEKLKGRHVHGTAGMKLEVLGGSPTLYLQSLSVNGVAVPEAVLTEFRSQNLLESANDRPEFRDFLRKIDNLHLENGQIVIQPKGAP